MSFPIRPEGDRIIVAMIPKKDEKVGNIIIPGVANSDIAYGYVKAIGNEIAHKYKDGDVVIYAARAGVSQLINGQECIWISLQNVWGWFSGEEWEKLSKEDE